MSLAAPGNHARAAINYDRSHFLLQGLDHLAFIDLYRERIRAFHVKDAELRPDGRQGVCSGFQPWLAWAVPEWECCLQDPEQGAREGAEFIRRHIIQVAERSFEDFAAGSPDRARIARVPALSGKAAAS
ncbi:MAG: sugar phosphate isomerase/epimerase family protein [Acetobacteraceae bacterium]